MDSTSSPQVRKQYRIGFGTKEIGDFEKIFDDINIDWEIIENPRAKIIELAEKNIGKPYKYGASVSKDAPDFFDCSSFTNWLYVQAGITLPRISIDQYVFCEEVSKEKISESEYFKDIVRIGRVKEADEARYIVILE